MCVLYLKSFTRFYGFFGFKRKQPNAMDDISVHFKRLVVLLMARISPVFSIKRLQNAVP